MSVDYKGLIAGNHNVIEVAKAIATFYGGSNFKFRFGSDSVADFGFGLGRGIDRGHMILEFNEEFSDEVKALRPWERSKRAIHRMMHVFSDGDAKSDYADITSEPMTYISLGHWGECKEIINALVAHFGGYIKDEGAEDEWLPLDPQVLADTKARVEARVAAQAIEDAEYARKADEKAA